METSSDGEECGDDDKGTFVFELIGEKLYRHLIDPKTSNNFPFTNFLNNLAHA